MGQSFSTLALSRAAAAGTSLPENSDGSSNPPESLIPQILNALHHGFYRSANLEMNLEALSRTERQRFHEAVPVSLWKEIKTLSRETDPQFLEEGLFELALRAERLDYSDLAYSAYAVLARSGQNSKARDRAKQRLEVLSGGGSFGAQAEYTFAHLVRRSFDLPNALAMGAGIGAFRACRYFSGLHFIERHFFILKRSEWLAPIFRLISPDTAAAALASVARLPFGHSVSSNVAGIVAAGIASTLVEKSFQSLFSEQPQDWSLRGFNADLVPNLLGFGMMFACAGMPNVLSSALGGSPARTPVLKEVAAQFGILMGTMGAKHLLEGPGNSKPLAYQMRSLLTDGVAALLHYNLARITYNKALTKKFLFREATMFGQGIFTPRRSAYLSWHL